MMYWIEELFVVLLISSVLSDVNHQPHCKNEERTCYHQLTLLNATREDCSIGRIESNSIACRDWPLKISGSGSLGQVVLHHYLYKSENPPYFTTGLNSTFSNIKWTRLRIQYKDRSNETFNFCREINLNSKLHLSVNANLFYDCLWALEHETKEFDFKYEAYDGRSKTTIGRHYIFKVPRHYTMLPQKPLQTWPIFMYIDISELPIMVLHWETHRQVTKFQVTVYQDNQPLESKKISGRPNEYGQFVYSYDIGFSSGKIHFSVQALHEECNRTCEIFKSSIIPIAENVSNRPLLIGIIGSVVLLPVVMYIFYIWKRYSQLAVDSIPVVLLVYRRSLRSHTQAVLAFGKYLRTFCHVNALIDELDIPNSKSKDPHKWYQEAFAQADVVLVISSPPLSDPLEEGLYQKVDRLALRILSEKYCDNHCRQKFLSLLMPYCSRDDIPTEAKNLKCYSFKKDLNELLWNMRYGLKSYWISKIDYLCHQSQVPGGNTDLRKHGKFLLDALQVAEDEVQKKPCKVIDDSDFEQVPLRVDAIEREEHFETHDSLNWLKGNRPDADSEAQEAHSTYPGDISNLDLLNRETTSDVSVEFVGKSECHRIDLNNLDL